MLPMDTSDKKVPRARAVLSQAKALDNAIGTAGTSLCTRMIPKARHHGCDENLLKDQISSLEQPDANTRIYRQNSAPSKAPITEADLDRQHSVAASVNSTIQENENILSASAELEQKWKEFQDSFQNMMNAMVERIGESLRTDPKSANALGLCGKSDLMPIYEHREIKFDEMMSLIRSAKKIVCLVGAGLSVTSGIPTYRGADGTWTMGSKNYTPQEIATLEMYSEDTENCWAYFTERWKMCREAHPNKSHEALSELERWWNRSTDAENATLDNSRQFTLISQNIDNLHTRAGSSNLLEIHGNLSYIRCLSSDCQKSNVRLNRTAKDHSDATKVPKCVDCGSVMRPHVLFFDECYSEELYKSSSAQAAISDADLLLVVGTMCCTSLPNRIVATAARRNIPVIDINPNKNSDLACAPLLQYVAKSDDVLPEIVSALKGR